MGAWGYKPDQNDTALDWKWEAEKHIDKAFLLREVQSRQPEVRRMAAELLTIQKTNLTEQEIEVTRNSLQELLEKDFIWWINDWNEPEEMKRLIQSEIDKL